MSFTPKEVALWQILEAYRAEDSVIVTRDVMSAIEGVMGEQVDLRDRFAMVALDGLFKCDPTDFYLREPRDRIGKAAVAYGWADAMMEARKK